MPTCSVSRTTLKRESEMTSPYNIFDLYRENREPFMLHIAIAVYRDEAFTDILPNIIQNETLAGMGSDNEGRMFIAADTKTMLQNKVEVAASRYPELRWIILSANTIGEPVTQPQLVYRSV